MDVTREDGATAGRSAYVRVEAPDQASLTLRAAPAPAEGGEPGTVTITVTDDGEDDDGETIVLAAESTIPALPRQRAIWLGLLLTVLGAARLRRRDRPGADVSPI